MTSLGRYLDELLSYGQAYFSREEALEALDLSLAAFIAAAGRLARKHRLACPRRGFYLILRPEDRVSLIALMEPPMFGLMEPLSGVV